MSEARANYWLLWLLSVQFPLMGLLFGWIVVVMIRRTTGRTPFGTTLIALFLADGLFLLALGGLFVRGLAVREGWPDGPSWLGWALRLGTGVFGIAVALAGLAVPWAMRRTADEAAKDGA